MKYLEKWFKKYPDGCVCVYVQSSHGAKKKAIFVNFFVSMLWKIWIWKLLGLMNKVKKCKKFFFWFNFFNFYVRKSKLNARRGRQKLGGGQNFERRNLERSIFRNFKIANIKITKDELCDSFVIEFFIFLFFINYLNTNI